MRPSVAFSICLPAARAGVDSIEHGTMLDEEGARLIYIVPRSFVDNILPLTIEPQPAKVHRVFVGRLELLTNATQNAIETAAAARDKATLAKYGRFLAPMIETILRERPDAVDSAHLKQAWMKIYRTYLAHNSLQNIREKRPVL